MNKIDLTPLVGSQILCEFWDNESPEGFFQRGFLSRIGVGVFRDEFETAYQNCRIYQHPDYWISSVNLIGQAFPSGLVARITLNDGRGYECITNGTRFINIDDGFHAGHISAVQVIGPADGWAY